MALPSHVGLKQARALQAVRDAAAKLVQGAQSSSPSELPKIAWNLTTLPGGMPEVEEAWGHIIDRTRLDLGFDAQSWGKLLSAFHQAKIVDLDVLNRCRESLVLGVDELDPKTITSLATAFSGPQVDRREDVLLVLCNYLHSIPDNALTPFCISALCKAYARSAPGALPRNLPPLLDRALPLLADNMNAQDLHNLCLFSLRHRCATTRAAILPNVERHVESMPPEYWGTVALCFAQTPLAARCVELSKIPASASIAVKLLESCGSSVPVNIGTWQRLALGLKGATRAEAVKALKCFAAVRFRAESVVTEMLDNVLESKEALRPWSRYEVCAISDALAILQISHSRILSIFQEALKDPSWGGEKRAFAENSVKKLENVTFQL